MLKTWIDAVAKAIQEMQESPERTVQVFHHNDADGLTSRAILTRALERQRYEVRRYCLEKPYPAVLRKVFEQKGKIRLYPETLLPKEMRKKADAVENARELKALKQRLASEAKRGPREGFVGGKHT